MLQWVYFFFKNIVILNIPKEVVRMKNSTVSSLLCLLAAAIWGFAFTAQKAAIAVPPFMLTAVRGWIAGLFLIFVTLLFDKLRGGKDIL